VNKSCSEKCCLKIIFFDSPAQGERKLVATIHAYLLVGLLQHLGNYHFRVSFISWRKDQVSSLIKLQDAVEVRNVSWVLNINNSNILFFRMSVVCLNMFVNHITPLNGSI